MTPNSEFAKNKMRFIANIHQECNGLFIICHFFLSDQVEFIICPIEKITAITTAL